MTPEDLADKERAIVHSQRAVNEIDALLDYEPFQRFLEKCRAEADSMAGRVLHDDMTGDDREKLRIRRLGWLDILAKPYQDRETHLRILEGFGVSLAPKGEGVREE